MSSALATLIVLPEAKQQELTTLEMCLQDAIDRGWRSFVDIGLALSKIREKELY